MHWNMTLVGTKMLFIASVFEFPPSLKTHRKILVRSSSSQCGDVAVLQVLKAFCGYKVKPIGYKRHLSGNRFN